MKTNVKEKKPVIQQLRDIREKLNASIKDMTHEQLKEYLDRQKTLHSTAKRSMSRKSRKQ